MILHFYLAPLLQLHIKLICLQLNNYTRYIATITSPNFFSAPHFGAKVPQKIPYWYSLWIRKAKIFQLLKATKYLLQYIGIMQLIWWLGYRLNNPDSDPQQRQEVFSLQASKTSPDACPASYAMHTRGTSGAETRMQLYLYFIYMLHAQGLTSPFYISLLQGTWQWQAFWIAETQHLPHTQTHYNLEHTGEKMVYFPCTLEILPV